MYSEYEMERDLRESRFNHVHRSRRYIFALLMLALLGAAAFVYSFLFGTNSSEIKLFIFADIFVVILLAIYWYLQVKPVYIAYDQSFERNRKWYQSEIDNIKEIEKAILIYDGTDGQERELAKFISARLDVFPYSFRKEFSCRESNLDFDFKILLDQTRLKLFKTSLETLKSRFVEEKRLQEEKTKKLGQDETEKEKSIDRMNKLIISATSRLKNEIEQLSKRANIYIIFGSAITLVAGVVLYFTVQDVLTVYSVGKNDEDTLITKADIFSTLIRLSIVVFVEVFAFYYLKLYKNIIEDVKFYQNEITNIEMKILGLYAAENGKCSESIKALSAELAKTERNFVIDKNKTTVDIEKAKQDSTALKATTDSVVKIMKTVKP